MATKSIKKAIAEAERATTITDTYKLKSTNNIITLTVIPGATGQSCLTDVFLDKKKILSSVKDKIEDHRLGTSNDLVLKRLEIFTLITDVQGLPDITSFEIVLHGGVLDYNVKLENTVSEQGQSIGYTANILFFR